jgi:hypothetical protein
VAFPDGLLYRWSRVSWKTILEFRYSQHGVGRHLSGVGIDPFWNQRVPAAYGVRDMLFQAGLS